MVLKKTEKLEDGRSLIEFLIEKASFDKALSDVYHREVKKINVPGFRKGKAPRAIIEKMYGKEVFYDDAINELLPEAYAAAVEESALKVVGHPEIDVTSIDEEGVLITAKVYVEPEFEIEGYKGLTAEKVIVPVSDEEIDHEIQTVRERNSRELEVTDRAVENGDKTVIDFEGFVDGVAFDGGKGENYPLMIGSGAFIPGFEDQIIGHNIGDEFDVNVKFPEEYHEASLAGKDAVFKVKLHSISVIEYPELDDDFAVDVSSFNTFAEYRADVKEKIERRHSVEAERGVDEALNKALAELVNAEIPSPMIEAEVDNSVNEYDSNLHRQGFSLEAFLSMTGQTMEQIKDQLRPAASERVKVRLALEKIVTLESIAASDDDIEAEYKSIVDAYGVDLDTVKNAITAEDLARDIAVRKAYEFVRENAVITEKVSGIEAEEANSDTDAE